MYAWDDGLRPERSGFCSDAASDSFAFECQSNNLETTMWSMPSSCGAHGISYGVRSGTSSDTTVDRKKWKKLDRRSDVGLAGVEVEDLHVKDCEISSTDTMKIRVDCWIYKTFVQADSQSTTR